MIIDYDHNPALTVDQKMQSLMESIQLALNEKPDVDEVRKLDVTGQIDSKKLLDMYYPVGSYYHTSDASFNPQSAWGGTWSLLGEGQVLLSGSKNGTYRVGTQYGSNTHKHTTGNFTLGTNHIPAHTHGQKTLTGNFTARKAGASGIQSYWGSGIVSVADSGTANITPLATTGSNNRYGDTVTINASHTHDSVGGGQAHNHGETGNSSNMQLSTATYIWHRTA